MNYESIKLAKNQTEPLHCQLSLQLEKLLSALPSHKVVKLASERKLAEHLNIARLTVHKAYKTLEEKKLVQRRINSKSLWSIPCVRHKLQEPFPSIGIILPQSLSDFLCDDHALKLEFLTGIIDRSADLGYSSMILQLPAHDASNVHMRRWEESVLPKIIGIIHLGDRDIIADIPLKRLLNHSSLPQVFVSGFSSFPHVAGIVGDITLAATAIAKRLYACGHRKIALVHYGENNSRERIYQFESGTRMERLRKILSCNNLSCSLSDDVYNGMDEKSLFRSLSKLISGDNAPSVLWTVNDHLARNTVKTLNALNVRVPEDVVVIGFDHLPQTEQNGLVWPSVRMPFKQIGVEAVNFIHKVHSSGIYPEQMEQKISASVFGEEYIIDRKNSTRKYNKKSFSGLTTGE